MTGAGYALEATSWHLALLTTIPAAVLISLALLLARRAATDPAVPAQLAGSRTVLVALVGVPTAGSGLPRRMAFLVSSLILLAGGVMFGAGYSLALTHLWEAVLLIGAGGLIVVAATVATWIADRQGQPPR